MGLGAKSIQVMLTDDCIDLIVGDEQLMPFLFADVSHDKDAGVGTALSRIINIT